MSAKWAQLHMDTMVRAADGFIMCKLVYEHTHESYEAIVKTLKIENPNTTYYARCDLLKGPLIAFLKSFADSTFCVSHYINEIDWGNNLDAKQSSTFLVGFRDKRDMFKFTKKMPGVSRTRWWRSDAKFVVLGKVGDTFYSSKPERFNAEDPHHMIKD